MDNRLIRGSIQPWWKGINGLEQSKCEQFQQLLTLNRTQPEKNNSEESDTFLRNKIDNISVFKELTLLNRLYISAWLCTWICMKS